VTATLAINSLRSIAFLICLASIAILVNPTFAKDATSPATRREAIKEKVETRKAAITEKIETRKENVANKISAMKERIATKEAAFKARLEAFKDKRKAEIAERVNTNLNKINKNHTDQMLKHLEKMSELLDKLEARVNSVGPDVKDPVVAKAAIADSRAKIAAATATVTAQSEKDYTLTITTESKVKADAQKMRDQLRADLQTTRQLVIDAKQSVANAIRNAKSSAGMKEGTASGQ